MVGVPFSSSHELASAIKGLAPSQRILMITAHVEELLSTGKPLAGADLLIGKLFDLEELRRAVSVLTKPS